MGNIKKSLTSEKLQVVYVVYPKGFKIEKLAKQLLDKKLVVCINVIPQVKSYYIWNSKHEKSTEIIALFKTTKRQLLKLTSFLKSSHPYEVPLVCVLGIQRANSEYLAYLSEQLAT